MNDIVQFPKTTTATAATAAVVLSGSFVLSPTQVSWPTQEPKYKISQDTPSFSLNEKRFATSNQQIPTIPQDFVIQIETIFSALSRGQEPLGSEFEAVWDANLSELYKS